MKFYFIFVILIQMTYSVEIIINYLETSRRAQIFEFHGIKLTDNYSWLEKMMKS